MRPTRHLEVRARPGATRPLPRRRSLRLASVGLVLAHVALLSIEADPVERRVERIEAERRDDGWSAPGRPALALALSGGGARGIAHLGVLQELIEDGVEFDAIAGTSIGSLIGGFVAAGYRPVEVQRILQRKNWDAIISGLDFRRRVLTRSEELLRSGQLSYSFGRSRRAQVGALAVSGPFERELYRYLLGAQLESGGRFDRLRYRWRPVAVDVLTGERVVPEHGDMVAAVRGSSAVPGVFRPIAFGDALLVDGGLLENIPVETARSFGADLVVAVSTSESVAASKKLRGAAQLLKRSLLIMTTQRDRELIALADLVLSPEVTEFSQASFRAQVGSLVEAGRSAYRARRTDLWRLLEANARDRAPMRYDRLEVRGTDWLSAEDLAGRLGGASGEVTRWRVAAELARALNIGPLARGHAEVVDTDGVRVLRFEFSEHAPVRSIEVHPEALAPAAGVMSELIGQRFSRPLAREIAWRALERWIERGRALVRLESTDWEAESGRVVVRLEEQHVERIETVVEGAISLARSRGLLDGLEGRHFTLDRLANRLDEMVARGAVEEWRLTPQRDSEGRVGLLVRLRGDDYYRVSATGAFRTRLGFAGLVRGAKTNFTGRGDFADLVIQGGRDLAMVQARYHTEYGVGNMGAEAGLRLFDNEFLIVDDEQKLVEDAEEEYAGRRAWIALIRRLRLGAVVKVGVFHETNRFDATATQPALRSNRTALSLEVELNRHERLLFPQHGGALLIAAERSIGGDSLWRAEVEGDWALSLDPDGSHVLTLRAGTGLSDDADRRPFWFEPGGYRDLYGFIPYGAAAPQYARAGLTWRHRVLDRNLARVYVETGVDWITRAVRRQDLGDDGGTLGYGVSLTANARVLGPISIGVVRNDDGADTLFLTVGLPLPRR